MKVRIRACWLVLGFAATSVASAAPLGERSPSYSEFNLGRSGIRSAPPPATTGLQGSASPLIDIPAVQRGPTPAVTASAGELVRPVTATGADPVLGQAVGAASPILESAGARKTSSSPELKSFLIDELDAKPMQAGLTFGREYFDRDVKARNTVEDPAAITRRHRVPASESPAAVRHRAPLQEPPKPAALVQMNRSPASEIIFNANATRLLDGAQKWHENVVKFAPGWQRASISEAISRHMGSDYRIVISKSGKLIYENKSTGVQIVIDAGNGYFRIFKPSAPGSKDGHYLNLDGEIPAAEIMTKNGLRRVPLSGGELNKATHFILQSTPRSSTPPLPS